MALFCLECDKRVLEPNGDKCPSCGAPIVDIIKFTPTRDHHEIKKGLEE